MKITVTGCGYLGAVHAVSMAELGHEVLGIEADADRARSLQEGRTPFYEPGMDQALGSALGSGRLRFTSCPDPGEVARAQVHFLCVGTPQSAHSGAADLRFLWSAVDRLLDCLPAPTQAVVVGKSTVPVGTAAEVARRLGQVGATLVWNPEFLREGHAVHDTLHPDRIVYGLPDDPRAAEHAQGVLDEVYAPVLAEGVERITANYATAELVKVAANSFRATKISFINAMAEMCEATGGDVTVLAEAIGRDERIGRRFLGAGVGFGGGCLPKDIRAFTTRARELGVQDAVAFLHEVDLINQRRRDRVVSLARRHLGGDLRGRRVTFLGAAFKPDSDDVRDSPALDVARRLQEAGALVTVCDPRALPVVRCQHPGLRTEEDPAAAMSGAEAVLLLTEWDEFTGLDPHEAATWVSRPVMIDGRNALDPEQWREAGWTYAGLGR